MTQHDPQHSEAEHSLATPAPGAEDLDQDASIVNALLDLDELMSADVRRARKSVQICIDGSVQAELDRLESRLATLSDGFGNPEPTGEASLGDPNRSEAITVAQQIQALRRTYASKFRTVELEAVSDDDWRKFETKHMKALDAGAPYPVEFWNELIAISALAPKMTLEQVERMRGKLGHLPMEHLGHGAWQVNNQVGVSVPKSQLSWAVLKQQERATS